MKSITRGNVTLRLIAGSVWLMLLTASRAATHYVVPPGTPGVTPTPPFTSWSTAGTNISEVVTAAQTNTAPRTVWVTNGTYYLTGAVDITRAITVKGVNGWSKTVIDGNAPAFTNYAFYIHMAAGETGIVDGFLITNCWNSGVRLGARSVVQNCLITGCRNQASGYPGNRSGGGIFTDSNTSPITISNCIVRANTCAIYGAGIQASYGNSGMLIVDSVIEDNVNPGSEGGGGINVNRSANVTISNCIIRGNLGSTQGGAVRLRNYSYNCTIVGCTIVSNTARYYSTAYGSGGGIYADATSAFTARDCVFRANDAANAKGGAIFAAGDAATLRNCLIVSNSAKTDGGGIWCEAGTIESCTIVTNRAGTGGTGIGGGICMDAAPGSVTGLNNIVYFNIAASGGDNFTNIQGNANLSYSCVFPAVTGTGNITGDPLLADLAGGDYRLSNSSPCIDSGLVLAWMTNACDLDGLDRILGGEVDMGAYEYDATLRGTLVVIR